MPDSTLPRRLTVPLAATLLIALVLLVAPAPGSLSVVGTRWLAALGSQLAHVELASELGLAVLAAATLAAGILGWFRHPERRAAITGSAAGVIAAYAASEGAKLLFAQPRPCSRWPIATECPPSGDWSLPSNHAALAFGAVVVISIAVGRLWIAWAAVALAAVVAVGRVAEGVHYVHDVALGAVFGLAVPTVLAAVATAAIRARSARDR